MVEASSKIVLTLLMLFTATLAYQWYANVERALTILIAPQYIRRPGQELHCNPGQYWDCADAIRREWEFLIQKYPESYAFWKLEMYLRYYGDTRINLHEFIRDGNHFTITASGTTWHTGRIERTIYLTEKFKCCGR